MIREVERALTTAAVNLSGHPSQNTFEGVLYLMHWRDESNNRILPLYVGKAGRHAKSGSGISANLAAIRQDKSKFARWGSNYAYHIGDLSAASCPGHEGHRISPKYRRWAHRLFVDAPTAAPTLRRPVFFWATAWGPQSYSIWEQFGACSLAFAEYLLIGVASELFPDILLNYEGVHRRGLDE